MGKEEEKALEDIQDYFLRLLWGARPGTPRVVLRADTATRSMSARIDKEKIMLVYHIGGSQPTVRQAETGGRHVNN